MGGQCTTTCQRVVVQFFKLSLLSILVERKCFVFGPLRVSFSMRCVNSWNTKLLIQSKQSYFPPICKPFAPPCKIYPVILWSALVVSFGNFAAGFIIGLFTGNRFD
jgi:hypothetical protein